MTNIMNKFKSNNMINIELFLEYFPLYKLNHVRVIKKI